MLKLWIELLALLDFLPRCGIHPLIFILVKLIGSHYIRHQLSLLWSLQSPSPLSFGSIGIIFVNNASHVGVALETSWAAPLLTPFWGLLAFYTLWTFGHLQGLSRWVLLQFIWALWELLRNLMSLALLQIASTAWPTHLSDSQRWTRVNILLLIDKQVVDLLGQSISLEWCSPMGVLYQRWFTFALIRFTQAFLVCAALSIVFKWQDVLFISKLISIGTQSCWVPQIWILLGQLIVVGDCLRRC